MGIFSGRNVRKAKSLVDRNRHKVGGMVDKATDQVDKITKGKTAGVTAKIDQAAHKFSGTVDEVDTGEADHGQADDDTDAGEAEASDDA